MQHLVKQDVFDGVAGHTRMVKNAADHDGVVGGIVMAETAAGVVSAPGQLWTTHQAVKEAPIEVVKNLFQMIVMAAGGVDVLASAHLPHQARFSGDIVARDVAPVTSTVDAINRLAIELGEQDVSDRMQHRFGRAFKQIGESNIEFSFPQANRVVNRNERIKTNMHGRRVCSRTHFAIGFAKDFSYARGHDVGRVARTEILINAVRDVFARYIPAHAALRNYAS